VGFDLLKGEVPDVEYTDLSGFDFKYNLAQAFMDPYANPRIVTVKAFSYRLALEKMESNALKFIAGESYEKRDIITRLEPGSYIRVSDFVKNKFDRYEGEYDQVVRLRWVKSHEEFVRRNRTFPEKSNFKMFEATIAVYGFNYEEYKTLRGN